MMNEGQLSAFEYPTRTVWTRPNSGRSKIPIVLCICYKILVGSWASGRSGGRPVTEEALTIDLGWLLRSSWMSDGMRCSRRHLTLHSNRGWSASVSYDYDMTDPDVASMTLIYRYKRHGEDWAEQSQHIWLDFTVPPYGGRRWWMLCPVTGERVGKLYLPCGGDEFAGRKAWRLGYRSQRHGDHDRALNRLFALQRQLGCEVGFQHPIRRPKGMWQRTYEQHLERYRELHAQICYEAMALIRRLGGNRKRC